MTAILTCRKLSHARASSQRQLRLLCHLVTGMILSFASRVGPSMTSIYFPSSAPSVALLALRKLMMRLRR